MSKAERFTLSANRLGPLPIINHFLEKLGLEELLEQFVPSDSARTKLRYSKGLGVLLRSILVEREPIYRQQEIVETFTPEMFGLRRGELDNLSDDGVGRALDRLFLADRGSLLTAVVVQAAKRFAINFDELHNGSTTVKFCGQHKGAKGRSIGGRSAPWITYGYSKDHRPDLKQLLFILTTSSDGGLPVQFRCEDGNTNDSVTHLETWKTLRELSGRTDFLYVADSKLCSMETMETIDGEGGRLVTVLPRSRQEDGQFREWIQENEPKWETVWDRPNPRKRYGPRDVWKVYRQTVPSVENWPIIWVFSSLLRLHQEQSRQERLTRGTQEIERLQAQLKGPRPRVRSAFKIEEKVNEIVSRLRLRDYLRAWVADEHEDRYRQETPGRPGKDTRYRRERKRRLKLCYVINEAAIAYDQKSDGMYPLLTNDRKLTPAQVLEAHKRQPAIEKRFEQAKAVHEIAPVFLKNEGRIEALFFLYFLALMVQALIERQVRTQMHEDGIEELPLYPEDRLCGRPSARRIFQLFSVVQGQVLREGGKVVQVFQPELTELQRQLITLLKLPRSAYEISA
jgi:transposase